MKSYTVKSVEGTPKAADFEKAGYAEINQYPWGGAYRPAARGALLRGKDRFYLRLEAAEPKENIRAQATGIFQSVHLDSCLEFFFCPVQGRADYINLELNPAGALHIAVGPSRQQRELRRDVDIARLSVQPFQEEENGLCRWGVSLEIPFSLIAFLLGETEYQPGPVLQGNFYKCGDETPVPHYGVWNPIDWPQPDYHRPEFFGTIFVE